MNYKEVVDQFINEAQIKHIFNKLVEEASTNNPFILATEDKHLIKYSTCCRSIDSRLGVFIGRLAEEIVKNRFTCLSDIDRKKVETKARSKIDLCFLKNNCWYIIELKSGGNIDSKKMRAERNTLDKLKVELGKIKKEVSIKFFYATAYENIENYDKLRFSSQERLIGKRFWRFICDDSVSYDYILKKFKDTYKQTIEVS